MRASVLVFVVAITAACGGDKKPVPPDPTRLVSDAEIDSALAELDSMLAANRDRTCERPPLRGAAKAGNADVDQLALAGKDRAITHCRERMVAKASNAEIASCSRGLVARLESAVSHGDACGVAIAGRNPGFDAYLGFATTERAVGLVAAERAGAGAHQRAIELFFDAMRYSADSFRGGELVMAVASSRTARWARAEITELLASDLPAAAFDSLAAQADALIDTEPSFGDSLASSYLDLVVELAPKLRLWRQDPSKKPPRGDLDASDDMGIAILAGLASHKAITAGCTETLERCHSAVIEISRGLDAEKLPSDRAARLETMKSMLGKPAAMRAKLIALYQSLGFASTERYITAMAGRYLELIAIRIAIELRRRAKCPNLETLTAATKTVRTGSRLGNIAAISSPGRGRFVLSLAPWVPATGKPIEPIELRCR